jgi:hypothetical protein
MSSASAVAPVGAGFGVKFCSSEMLTAGPAMAAFTENPYIINEILFHQEMQK